MGRPIKTAKLIGGVISSSGYENGDGLGVVGGDTSTPGNQIACEFNVGTGVKTGWIVRQKGAKKFYVTDGTDSGTCVLVDGATPGLNEMSIAITTAAAATEYLAKFNETIGVTTTGNIYHLSFNAASATPPVGSAYQIAQVASS